VTTENTDFTSGLDQDQAELDAVQEGTPQAVNPVTEELQALRREMTSQIAGLQSKVDRGLNGMRAQYETAEQQQRYQAMQQFAQDIPEDQRAGVEYLINRNAQLEQAQTQAQSADPEAERAAAEWEVIYDIARNMGVDPETPGIDYDAYTEPGLDQKVRNERFFASLRRVMERPTPEPAAQQPASTQQPEVQNPPQAGTPANGVATNLRTVEQVQRAYIEGKLSTEDYTKRLSEAGQQ
tara:strand:- start:268 stop:981 length:714 start_codon:yes stop_codon:yes gene_type:complete